MSIKKIQEERGFTLPGDYLDFIAGFKLDDASVREYREGSQTFNDRDWAIYGEEILQELTRFFEFGLASEHKLLEALMSIYTQVLGKTTVTSPQGGIPVERIANGFVIGRDEAIAYDGEYVYLYLDPGDGFSVWEYHCSGADAKVRKVACSFKAWLEQRVVVSE